MQGVENQAWSELPHVFVQGDKSAKSREEDPAMETWKRVAVMSINYADASFRPGFFNEVQRVPMFCKEPHENIGRFGMRVGPEDVFFTILADSYVELTLEGVYDMDDPSITEIPLF